MVGNALTVTQKNEFSLLVKLNMKRAYFVALGLLGTHDDAMDASQEAFIKAFENYYKFDRDKKFFTWYYKILRNICLNRIRSNKQNTFQDIFEVDLLIPGSNPEDDFDLEETKKILGQILFELDTDEREVILLKEYQGFSYKEISEIMDIPIGTVMSKIFYSRKKIFEKLKRKL